MLLFGLAFEFDLADVLDLFTGEVGFFEFLGAFSIPVFEETRLTLSSSSMCCSKAVISSSSSLP